MIEKETVDLVRPFIEQAGYLLDSVLFVEENGIYFLRLFLDKKEGYVTVEDCVTVCNLIGEVIEEKDYIQESYILDVCSKEKGCE